MCVLDHGVSKTTDHLLILLRDCIIAITTTFKSIALLWHLFPYLVIVVVTMTVSHGAVCCHHLCRCSDVVTVDFHNGCLLSV
jgi:hypothetical protein